VFDGQNFKCNCPEGSYSRLILEPELLMPESAGSSLMEHLRQVPDPRVERTRRHELMDLLVIRAVRGHWRGR